VEFWDAGSLALVVVALLAAGWWYNEEPIRWLYAALRESGWPVVISAAVAFVLLLLGALLFVRRRM